MGDVAMVTGHRDVGPAAAWVSGELERVAAKLEPGVMVSGMAVGVDQWWAKLALRTERELHAYIPFRGQENRWPKSVQAEYHAMLRQAAVVDVAAPALSMNSYRLRNSRMVAASAVVVAVWDPRRQTSGTGHAVGVARRLGRTVVHIDPVARTTRLQRVEGDPPWLAGERWAR